MSPTIKAIVQKLNTFEAGRALLKEVCYPWGRMLLRLFEPTNFIDFHKDLKKEGRCD